MKDIDIPLPDNVDGPEEVSSIGQIVTDEGIDPNHIYYGDTLDLLRSLPDESVDMVITSPPYNLGKSARSPTSFDEYLDFQEQVIDECIRVLKEGGSIFWQVAVYTKDGQHFPLDVKVFPMFEERGMKPRNRIIWTKGHGYNAKKRFSCRHETMLWFTKGDDYKFDVDPVRVPQKWPNKKSYSGDNKGEVTSHPDGKNPGDVWDDITHIKWNNPEQTIHSAQFPEELARRAILPTTDEDDLILDPFIGTGTVARVAKDYDRQFIGAEIGERIWKVAKLRIEKQPDANGNFVNLKQMKEVVGENPGPEYGYHRRPVQEKEEYQEKDENQTDLNDLD